MENRKSEPSVGGGANREDAGMITTSAQSSLRNLRLAALVAVLLMASVLSAQVVTVTIQGRVYDTTGAAISQANVSVTNPATGFSRSATASATGDYQISALPVGDYTVTAEKSGFQKQAKRVHLDIGASGNVDFNLAVGQIAQEVTVQDVGEVAEPTRTMVSSVIDEQKIENLPVNGRQFIDFALLAPGVKIGDTTSGSTDVIIEPVTKLSFAGQNIHYNFIPVGATTLTSCVRTSMALPWAGPSLRIGLFSSGTTKASAVVSLRITTRSS